MVAGEERLTFAVGETQMVRGVAGSRHRLDRPVRTRHHIAVRQYAIGRIIPIESGVRARTIVIQDQRRTADDFSAGRSLQRHGRSEAHTSALPSLMRHSYAVFCL